MKRACLFSILVCTLFAQLAFGAGGTLPGNGTEENPYLIEDLDDFDAFADTNNAGTYWSIGIYTKLMCDIDLSGRNYTSAVIAPDTSSSSKYQGESYRGYFNGNSFEIRNLSIDNSGTNSNYLDYLGLFGLISDTASILNLTLSNAVIVCGPSSEVAGAICGENFGLIENCDITVTISGEKQFGGICGGNLGVIQNCRCSAELSGLSQIGGLCSGTGNGGQILRCSVNANITGSYESWSIGGFCGENRGAINDCYATGSVTVGLNCYGVGGFCGQNNTTIINCYSTVFVDEYGQDLGGFCGQNPAGLSAIHNCFWDITTSSQTTSNGGTGLTTSLLKRLETFTSAGWDFSDTDGDPADWQMPDNDYPRLAWQTLPVNTPYSVTGEYWYGMLESDMSSGGVGTHSGQATFTEANISQQFNDDAGNDVNESVSITDSYVDEDGWLNVELDGGELVTSIPGKNLITSINRQVDPENDLSSYIYAKKAIGISEQDIIGEYAAYSHYLSVSGTSSDAEIGVVLFYYDHTWAFFGQDSDGTYDFTTGTWTLDSVNAILEVDTDDGPLTYFQVGQSGVMMHFDNDPVEDDDLGFTILLKKGFDRSYETAAGRYLYQEFITDVSNKAPETGWGVLTINSDGTWSITQSFNDGSSGSSSGMYLIEDDGTIYFYDPDDQIGYEATLSQDSQLFMLAIMGQDGDVGIGIAQRSSDCNGNDVVDILDIPGDATGDGIVNLLDFAKLAENWLDENCGMCNCSDFSCNGEIDFDDLNILTANWLNQ